MSESPSTTPIALETKGTTVIARPEMKMLDDDALKTLTRAIDDAASPGSGVALVILDLSRVAILPSLALGLLVQISIKCRERQQKLKLAGLRPQLREVFSITRLERVFQFSESVEDAING